MNKNTISVELTVKDNGSVVMKQFGKTAEDAMNKAGNAATRSTSTFDSMKGSYLEFTAKAASAYMAITTAMEYMDKGAKATQAEAAFTTLAAASNESANAIIANMKRATNSTIDDSQMMQKAAKAMMLEFSGDQMAKMSEMARMGARTSGENVGQVFDSIVDSISTNMPKALKRYGLITKEQMSMINQAMAEGVEGIDLYSLAIANLAVQQAKMGPLLENDAEKMQQYRAQIEDTQESFGKILTMLAGGAIESISKVTEPFAALAASFATLSGAPMIAYLKKLAEIDDGTKKLAETNKTAAEENKRNIENQIKATQALAAQKKAELETMKALNKDYFASQEANLKAMVELVKAAGGDEYKATLESFKKREELNAEFYTRTKREIELEAAARQKADRDKISDASFVLQKIQALDTETTSKAIALYQQKTQASIQAAQADITSLKSRLSEYQTYYDSLKAKMDKNIEDEKKHLDAIKALRQQSIDIDKSAEAQLALINGTNKGMTDQQKYESGRSALNQQYMDITNNMTGQDLIKALEGYIKAVSALQQQFPNGVQGPKDIFGKPADIISAAKVAGDASSDINRALALQQSAVVQLREEEQKNVAADQLWGQTLQQEAQKAQAEMEKLKQLISDISTQIQNMQKVITLTSDDKVSSVIDGIMTRIRQLHELAAKPIVLTTTMSGGGGYGTGNTPLYGTGWDSVPQYAAGTNYVPRTGIYKLHQGEAVVPAAQNNNNSRSMSIGDINIIIPASAAPQRPEDWRMITRNYIIPEMRKLM